MSTYVRHRAKIFSPLNMSPDSYRLAVKLLEIFQLPGSDGLPTKFYKI